MAELKQKSLEEIGLFVPPTFNKVRELWPRMVPLTPEIYRRVIGVMETRQVDLQEAYRLMQEEDSQPDHPWSR